jgi:hypothetical protein
MKTKFVLVLVLSVVSIFYVYAVAADFPVGSAMNFNPAYMASNAKWSFSYETYFEGQKMNFVAFQPFENGFAGKLGVYADGKGNGIVYSIASKRGSLAVGSDFLLSNEASSIALSVGIGMTQNVLENLVFDLRVPQALTYIYERGIEVHPNAKMALNFEEKNWNAALFGGVDYPWVNGGAWGSVSIFGIQAYGYLETGYDSSKSGVEELKLNFILQYTLSNVKLAYIYGSHTFTTPENKNETNNGIRVSVEW